MTQIGAREFIQHLLPNNVIMSDRDAPSLFVMLQEVTSESASRLKRVLWTK